MAKSSHNQSQKCRNELRAMVREEMRAELVRVREELEEKIDTSYRQYRDEILTRLDAVAGLLKNPDEEHELLHGQHRRILEVEERVEKLERLHPQGQHSP